MSDDTGTSSSRPPLRAVKKIQSAGRGKLPNYGEGYRVQLHYEVLKPPASGEWPEDRSLYKSIDSTKRPWPHGYGQPLELVLGKKFQLPILEQLVETMLENEVTWSGISKDGAFGKSLVPTVPLYQVMHLNSIINTEVKSYVAALQRRSSGMRLVRGGKFIAQFDVDAREVLNFPLVAKKLRDIAKTRDKHGDQCQHDSHHHHGHSHGVGMSCAAAALSGTGYEELDELLKTPSPLRMIVHLLKVEPPETYAPDAWQLSADEKLASIDGLREKGNEAYRNADYSTAMETYREALGRLETLILREKPGDPEWTSLDERTTPLYLNLAQCLLSAGEYAEANAAATEALQRQPTNEKALYRRIKARMMLWQLDEAELDLQELEKHHGDRCEQVRIMKCIPSLNCGFVANSTRPRRTRREASGAEGGAEESCGEDVRPLTDGVVAPRSIETCEQGRARGMRTAMNAHDTDDRSLSCGQSTLSWWTGGGRTLVSLPRRNNRLHYSRSTL